MKPKTKAQRDSILQHATGIFAEKGYSAAYMREIAESAKVTKPTIYYYFPGKRKLYLAILREASEALRSRLADSACPQTTAGKTLRDTIATIIAFSDRNHDHCRILGEALRYGESEFQELAFANLRFLREKVQECIQSGIEKGEFRSVDPDLAALTVVGTVASQISWTERFSEEEPAEADRQRDLLDRLPSYFAELLQG